MCIRLCVYLIILQVHVRMYFSHFLHSCINLRMDDKVKFVLSRNGVRLLEFNNYIYRKNGRSENGAREYFKCQKIPNVDNMQIVKQHTNKNMPVISVKFISQNL